MILELKNKILSGQELTDDEVYSLCDCASSAELRSAAAEITRSLCPPTFDSCSIVNARSGRCPENCKWCAQSSHYPTSCSVYELLPIETCLEVASYNKSKGIRRFSMVTSGKATKGATLDAVCHILGEVRRTTGIETCASLGLLDETELRKLWETGTHRYHCNLETAPSFFPSLCSTHTIDDKIRTIETAKKIGFEICSGGIIGMGETARQRAELAVTLRRIRPVSIPINILSPIPGTPLADMEPITADEILDTLAIFRFAHPTVQIRFAGGRSRLSRQEQLQAMAIAVNGAIVGDLLTTVGSTVDQDKQLVEEAKYKF